MANFTQFLINAVALSSLYALVAVGFTLIFGVGDILNFGHAGLLTAGAYAAYQVSNPNFWGLNIWIGVAAAAATGGLLGATMYWFVVRYVAQQRVIVAILTLIVGFIVMFLAQIGYGLNPIQIRSPTPGIVSIAEYQVQTHFILTFLTSSTILGLLFWVVNNTEPGRAILATSMSDKGAAIVGIPSHRINLYVWTVAGLFAGFAGLMLTAFRTGHPFLGLNPMIVSFAIVILGGLGSIRGSVVGAYIIGFMETASTTYISSSLTGLVSLILMVAVLLVKPTGIYGREAVD